MASVTRNVVGRNDEYWNNVRQSRVFSVRWSTTIVSLIVGVHVDGIIVSGESDVCDEFFSGLKERFPVKHQGELKMYTSCAFERD